MSRWIYRVALVGLDAAGTATTYHYATESFSTSPTRPTIPNTFLDGRLSQPLLFQRDMFGPGQTRGQVSIAHGVIELENSDGGLDTLPAAAAFDVQRVDLYRFDSDAPDSTEVRVWSGVMESTAIDLNKMSIMVRDFIYRMDIALRWIKYLGNNSLPNGIEGTAADIKGQPKPFWRGVVFNVSPPCVNTARLIYQMNYEGVFGSAYTLTVYDSRVALTAGALVSGAAMLAGYTALAFTVVPATDIFTTAVHGYTTADPVSFTTTGGTLPAPLADTTTYYVRVLSTTTFTVHPTAADASANTNIVNITTTGAGTIDVASNRTAKGCYDYSNNPSGTAIGFFIRLGSKPVGSVTVDADDGNGFTFALLAGEFPNINSIGAGWVLQAASTVGYTPNASITNQKVGLFITQEMTVFAALQLTCQSFNASFGSHLAAGFSNLPLLHISRLEPATTQTAILTLTDDDIRAGTLLRGVASGDPDRGIPSWRANIAYTKNGTVMTAADAPATTQADLGYIENEFRTLQATKTSVQTQYPASPEIAFTPSVLADSATATEFGAYLITSSNGVYSKRRDVLTFEIDLEKVMELSLAMPANSYGSTATLTGINALLMAQSINVNFARFAGPVDMRLIGYKVDIQHGTVELTLWG
jgi:hypothetical protein